MILKERNWKHSIMMTLSEVKKQLRLVGPLFAASLLQYSLQPIALMFVGHLGDQLALSAASIAASFASVTGTSPVIGVASGLDTLCGQSFGAAQYHMVGLLAQRAMLLISILNIFLAILWANTNHILIALRQDATISQEAGKFALFMIPGLFAYGLLECLVRFLRAQKIVYPVLVSSAITTSLHVFLCWGLVLRSGLGFKGAALAYSISYWVNLLILALYVKHSDSCAKTWTGFSREAMSNLSIFIRIAIPATLIVCLKMWAFELLVLFAGLLPNPKLETSVLAICLNTATIIWTIYYGLGAAVSTRVSNELGASQPQAAKVAAISAIFMAFVEGIVLSFAVVILRNVWGHVFTSEKEVVVNVGRVMPILAAHSFLDTIQTTLIGIARGCGRQKLWAWIQLGSTYFLGVPLSVLLTFILHLGAKGLWLGIVFAYIMQLLVCLPIIILTNWEKQVDEAAKRVDACKIPTAVTEV